ncbi:MAG TPA: EamA family transporter [Oscillospiraceae bacterium]|nr:EamA family transporter [Oscillospiraceae bacterium]HPS75676.1 EamA family transporter [Oscillospiraceae bacterium]
MTYLLIVCMTLLSAFGGYFLKKASGATKNFWKLMINKNLWIGGGMYVTSTVFMIWLLQMTEYSVAVPLGSMTYVWSIFIAKHLLGETITKRRVAGICCIVGGVLLMATA